MDRRTLLLTGAAAAAGGFRDVGAALQALVHPGRPDAVLGVAAMARDRRGRLVLAEAAGRGVRGSGPTRREFPFTLDTPVRVASISKLATAAVFMRLAESGAVRLDEDVSERLGWRLRHPAHPDVPITPRLLAAHLAGLRNGTSFPVPVGHALQEAFAPGGRHWDEGSWFAPATEPPGRWWAYADVNSAVLAQVLERATGERFDRLARRLLFDSAGLEVGFNWSGVGQAKRDRASACCSLVDGVWTPGVDAEVPPAPEPWINAAPERPGLRADDYRPGENGFAFSPQGGLRASVRDLDLWAVVFGRGGGTALSRGSVDEMSRPAWRWRTAAPNGTLGDGLIRTYGLCVQAPSGAAADAFFGPGSADWRGHFGEAYGLVSGLWWNRLDGRTLAYVINGTPRPAEAARTGSATALTPWERAVFAAAQAAWR